MIASAAASVVTRPSLVPVDKTQSRGSVLSSARVLVTVKGLDFHVGTQEEENNKLHATHPPAVIRRFEEAVH